MKILLALIVFSLYTLRAQGRFATLYCVNNYIIIILRYIAIKKRFTFSNLLFPETLSDNFEASFLYEELKVILSKGK